MIVKSAKVIDSLFWWQYCEFGWERTAACGIRTDSIRWTEPLVSKRIVEALNINPSVKVDGFSSVCMFDKTMTDDDKEYRGHSG